MLVHIIRLVENAYAEGKTLDPIELFLNIGSLCICGDVISAEEFSQTSKGLVKLIHDRTEEALADAIVRSDLTLDEIKNDFPRYLHLKNAVICMPDGTWNPEGDSTAHYRCRLSSVDGFYGDSIGTPRRPVRERLR